VSGVGIRKNRRGRKVRKTVAGNTIYTKTAQINLKILKHGSKPLAEEKKEEKKEEGKEEKKADEKKEKPGEKKKSEEKKEEAKE